MTSKQRNADDAARSSEYWKAELLAANAIIERQQAEIERLRDGLREARLEAARTAAEGLRAIGSAVETAAEPASVLAWAVRSFGPIALNRDERAARMAEEAIEVAQVEGVPLDVMQRITARVYSRPVGELGQEIGGLMVGLYALAARAGVDIEAEFKREFTRVLSKPADWWARKHAEKVAAGTADLTPVKTSGEPSV